MYIYIYICTYVRLALCRPKKLLVMCPGVRPTPVPQVGDLVKPPRGVGDLHFQPRDRGSHASDTLKEPKLRG